MDVWKLQAAIVRRLLIWSGLSVVGGIVLSFVDPFWHGVGLQAIVWGVIDAAIALGGKWAAGRRRAGMADPTAPQVVAREATNLRRLLWINAGLDVLYAAGGVTLARTPRWV